MFDAAIVRAGMLRVYTIAELFEAAEALGRIGRAGRSKLALLTNAGGPGAIAADAAATRGAALAGAPVDLGGDATGPRYAEALREALAESAAQNTIFSEAS